MTVKNMTESMVSKEIDIGNLIATPPSDIIDDTQLVRREPGNDDKNRVIKIKRDDCANDNECICKIKQALALVIDEIIKIDGVILGTSVDNEPQYRAAGTVSATKPEDKKEFAKSVLTNSSVCHVIIQELKYQRTEIDEMLTLYRASTSDFAKLERALNRQREKIKRVEDLLGSVEGILKKLNIDMAKRDEYHFRRTKIKHAQAATRDKSFGEFLDWTSSLDVVQRPMEKETLDIEETMLQRNRDRMMLTLAVKQLEEVRNIDALLTL